jgi:hypothetical protein
LAGYSGTPLAQKLGIKPGMTLVVLHAPDDYAALLQPLPKDVSIADRAKPGAAPFVHLFVENLAELERDLPAARKALSDDGGLWISWYKKSAKVSTDVTEDRIRERILKTDLVDVKVCAVSEIWSGLKCVIRKDLRGGHRPSR